MELLKSKLKIQSSNKNDINVVDGFITKDYKNYSTISNGKIRIPEETLPITKMNTYSNPHAQSEGLDLVMEDLKEVKLTEEFSPKKFEIDSEDIMGSFNLGLDLGPGEEAKPEPIEEPKSEIVVEDTDEPKPVIEINKIAEEKPKKFKPDIKKLSKDHKDKVSIWDKIKNILGIGKPKKPKEPKNPRQPKQPEKPKKPVGPKQPRKPRQVQDSKLPKPNKKDKPETPNNKGRVSLLNKKEDKRPVPNSIPRKNGKDMGDKQKSINEMLLNSETYQQGNIIINKNEKVGDE